MNNNIENIEQDNPIFKAPYLIFDKNVREEAREEVDSLGGIDSLDNERLRVIELVITNGLYEYYPVIPELSKPFRMNRIINGISSKEETYEEQSLKNLEMRRLYWKHVLYPEAVRQICNDSVYEKGIEKYWLSLFATLNPVDEYGEMRIGYLLSLIGYYKSCDTELQKEAIKRFLKRQVGDYPI